MINKLLFLPACALFFLIVFSFGQAVRADAGQTVQIAAPTILVTTQIEEATSSQIQVNGLISNGNRVLIYINGKYDGMANISEINANISKFSYLSSAVDSDQSFEIMAIAQNLTSLKFSAPTFANVYSVIEKTAIQPKPNTVLHLEPAKSATINPPILLAPAQTHCVTNPLFSGTVASDSAVYIYIDNSLSAIIPAADRSPDVSLFSFAPKARFARGSHSIYAVAKNDQGQTSIKSNVLTFCVATPITTATSTTNQALTNTGDLATNSDPGLVIQKTNPENYPNNSEKNLFNLIIFIVFVVGLISWMFIVGKELNNDREEATSAISKPIGKEIPDKE